MTTIQLLALLPVLALSTIHCTEAQETDTAGKEKKLAAAKGKSIKLFDGKTFDGWKTVTPANIKYWSIENGVLTADNDGKKIPVNTYLATKKSYKNFIFKCKFRLSGDHESGLINAGIQYRSTIKGHKIIGYQADIGKGYWGNIWDEHRRGLLAKGNTAEVFKSFKEDDWGTYTIACKDNRHKLYINGILVAEYTEKDTNISNRGVFALQVHSGGAAKAEYKNVTIQELP